MACFFLLIHKDLLGVKCNLQKGEKIKARKFMISNVTKQQTHTHPIMSESCDPPLVQQQFHKPSKTSKSRSTQNLQLGKRIALWLQFYLFFYFFIIKYQFVVVLSYTSRFIMMEWWIHMNLIKYNYPQFQYNAL